MIASNYIRCDIFSMKSDEAREVPTKLQIWGGSQRCMLSTTSQNFEKEVSLALMIYATGYKIIRYRL